MHRNCLRAHDVVRRLLSRDMRRQRLGLRAAARAGGVAIGTLASMLDGRRLRDPDRRPKRGVHRGTLMQLRHMAWIGGLSAATLDRLIAARVAPSLRGAATVQPCEHPIPRSAPRRVVRSQSK